MPTDALPAVIFTILSYLLGAVPFSLLLARSAGVDLRTVGSGNVGAGNLTREVGVGYGAGAAVLDGLKGLLPVLIARRLGLGEGVVAAGGVAAVVGHNWSIYLRSRSGRGLATAVGVLLGLAPGLLLWTGLWAASGWWIGGGLAGFVGWSLLGPVAFLTGYPPLVVSVVFTLATVVMVRRIQGNMGAANDARSRLHRLVWDTDRPDGLDDSATEEGATT